jgi:hypothetical protein
MRTIARRVAALLASCFIAGAAFAQSGPTLASRLVGHWSLVSIAIGGQQPYGAAPQGSMFFDTAGHYSVVIAGVGRAGALAYFGEYKVDEAASAVTLHIDAGSRPSAAGRDERRIAALDGDQLTLRNGSSASGLGSVALVWKRAD